MLCRGRRYLDENQARREERNRWRAVAVRKHSSPTWDLGASVYSIQDPIQAKPEREQAHPNVAEAQQR